MIIIDPTFCTGNHLRKIAAMVKCGDIGNINEVVVTHDDYCSIFKGVAVCDCDPNVYVKQTVKAPKLDWGKPS